MREAVTPATKVIMLCTPNNPTGPAVDHEGVLDLLDAVPDHVLIIIDEAYVEFVRKPDAVRGLEALAGRPNVVVLRTFSKAYGLAGFRVGYCVADPRLATARPGRLAAVRGIDRRPGGGDRVAGGRGGPVRTGRDSDRAPGTSWPPGCGTAVSTVPDAQGNFIWLPAGPRTAEYDEAFARAGLIVRPYAAGDSGDGLRITVGEPEANARVLDVAAGLPR